LSQQLTERGWINLQPFGNLGELHDLGVSASQLCQRSRTGLRDSGRNRRSSARTRDTSVVMDRAAKNNERFVFERRVQPAVVIMSVGDFIRPAAPPPDRLEKAWRAPNRAASTS
jgi:hypothetical protein